MIDDEKINGLEQARRAAMLAADTTTLSDLLADDLLWIHATGSSDSKDSLLQRIGSGATKYHSIEVADETLRVVNDVALLSGHASMQLEVKGQTRPVENKFTIVWAEVDGRWQVVNWQSTSIRKP